MKLKSIFNKTIWHYQAGAKYKAACGISSSFYCRVWPYPIHEGTACVTCVKCQNTKIYKIHQTHADLKFEGTLTHKWLADWTSDGLPKL